MDMCQLFSSKGWLFLADATLWNPNNKHTENVRLSDPTFTLLFNCYLNQE